MIQTSIPYKEATWIVEEEKEPEIKTFKVTLDEAQKLIQTYMAMEYSSRTCENSSDSDLPIIHLYRGMHGDITRDDLLIEIVRKEKE